MSPMEQLGTAPKEGSRMPPFGAPDIIVLVMAAIVLVAFRMHAFALPLETDECNYAYIGGRLLAGDRLYVDVWDHQPFGVFALFAAAISVFGDGALVFRWMAVLFSVVSLILIYLIVRSCATCFQRWRIAAGAAAVLFAMASSDPGTAGEGCNREVYMSTFVLLAWYLALQAERKGSGWPVFLAGCSLAVGSCIKTIVAVHWVALALWLAVQGRQPAAAQSGAVHRGARRIMARLALFSAGPALLWLAAGGYYALTYRWDDFIDAVFTFNLSYSGESAGMLQRFVRFFGPERHPFIFDSALPLWLGAVLSVPWLAARGVLRRDRVAWAIVLLLVSGYVAACLPSKFWPHYYYLLLPPAIIAVAVAADRLAGTFSQLYVSYRRACIVAVCGIFGLWPVALFATEYRAYLSQPPFGITVKRYNSRDFWGRAQGKNVQRVTAPSDTVFVYSNEVEIYYYSQRRCASRYTMITGLQSGYAGHARRRAIMIDELRRNRPRVILVLFDEPPFAAWKALLEEQYEAVGFDRNDTTGKYIMFVYARKDAPIEPIDWDWDRSAVGGWALGERP